jgi:phospholipase C
MPVRARAAKAADGTPGFRRPVSRREFVAGAVSAAGALAAGCGDGTVSGPLGARLHFPRVIERSGIQHIIVVMMENRSFDHLLGWLPHADGRQRGLTYVDAMGASHATYPLAPDFEGCGYGDPDHSYAGGRVEYNGGACDGWLRANDRFAIGYYRKEDLAFLGRAAPHWTTFDRYFAAIMAETFPNRLYQHAAQTDRLHNTAARCTLPTIWDRLAGAGVDGRYYNNGLGFLSLWGDQYLSIGRSRDMFYQDCAAGTLPHVAFVDPPSHGENPGASSSDDHPYGDIRAGETFLNGVYNAVTRSPCWPRSVLVITFDEWGGFFDHVPPPAAPIPDADRAAGATDGLRGFRIPVVLVSPFARREHTSHTLFDHTSILRMIEWRWDLEPLTVRDATANNLADVLDLQHPQLHAPSYPVPTITGAPCAPRSSPSVSIEARPETGVAGRRAYWQGLRALARQHGWAL